MCPLLSFAWGLSLAAAEAGLKVKLKVLGIYPPGSCPLPGPNGSGYGKIPDPPDPARTLRCERCPGRGIKTWLAQCGALRCRLLWLPVPFSHLPGENSARQSLSPWGRAHSRCLANSSRKTRPTCSRAVTRTKPTRSPTCVENWKAEGTRRESPWPRVVVWGRAGEGHPPHGAPTPHQGGCRTCVCPLRLSAPAHPDQNPPGRNRDLENIPHVH